GTTDIEDLDRAHATVLDVILRQQLADLRDGVALTNRIDPAKLDRLQTRRLKAAIAHMKITDDLVRDRLMG
ncbi:MAG: putative nucleotidyltransferase substrate binding domain-containing protein, partial [Beijerinckiaceae bacterium]